MTSSRFFSKLKLFFVILFLIFTPYINNESKASEEDLNLLINPGFENSNPKTLITEGWKQFGDRNQHVSVIDENPREGKLCILLDNGDRSIDVAKFQTQVVLNQEKPEPLYLGASARVIECKDIKKPHYRFSIWLSCKYASGRWSDELLPGLYFNPFDNSWQDKAIFWIPPEPIELCKFSIVFCYKGKVCFDNMRLSRAKDIMSLPENPERRDDEWKELWKPVDFVFDFNSENKDLPDGLITHLGYWKTGNGVLSSCGDLPLAGAILRAKDTYFLSEYNMEFEPEDDTGALYLLLGDWRIGLHRDHIGVRHLFIPSHPVVKQCIIEKGKRHKILVNIRPEQLLINCDGKDIIDLRTTDIRDYGKNYRTFFRNPQSSICIQAYEGHVSIFNIGIKGLNTGIASGFQKLQ